MFNNFDDFLNEGKKYPDFAVGDIVKTVSYEYDYGSSMYKASIKNLVKTITLQK